MIFGLEVDIELKTHICLRSGHRTQQFIFGLEVGIEFEMTQGPGTNREHVYIGAWGANREHMSPA